MRQYSSSLARQWWNDPNYGHGFFVPVFAGYVLWSTRDRWRALPFCPNNFGFAIMLFAIALRVLGMLGAELFMARLSLVILICRNRPISGRSSGAAVDCISDRLSALYDPLAGNRVLPVDTSSSVVGIAIGCDRSGRARDSHRARGESALSTELHAQCGRSVQRNSLFAFSAGRSRRLRVLGRAEHVETHRLGGREHSNRDRDQWSASRRDGRAELLTSDRAWIPVWSIWRLAWVSSRWLFFRSCSSIRFLACT